VLESDSKYPLTIPVVMHMTIRIRKFMTTLKFVSFSILLRFDGVSPPLSMILVSAPVKTTSPMTQFVFRTVHPRRRRLLIVIGSNRSSSGPPCNDVRESSPGVGRADRYLRTALYK
jgi:hypothetical protein